MRNVLAPTFIFLACHLLHSQASNDTVYTHVEQMPYFPGCHEMQNDLAAKQRCSDQRLVQFIAENMVYPQEARDAGVEGVVLVSFIINENGGLVQPAVLMDIGGGCGEAALELLLKMPRWEPGKEHGKKVKVRLNLPIQFYLSNNSNDNLNSYTLTWGTLKGNEITIDDLKGSIENNILVRDQLGNLQHIGELTFAFEKNNRLVNAKSRGTISKDLIKIIDKVKKGGIFTITASVQDQGKFIDVSRAFKINN